VKRSWSARVNVDFSVFAHIEDDSSGLLWTGHPSPLLFWLSDEPFLNLREDFVEPLFSTFSLLLVKLNLSF